MIGRPRQNASTAGVPAPLMIAGQGPTALRRETAASDHSPTRMERAAFVDLATAIIAPMVDLALAIAASPAAAAANLETLFREGVISKGRLDAELAALDLAQPRSPVLKT